MSRSLFFRILNRLCVFLFLFLCVIVLLFIYGNKKDFLDSTLIFLTEISKYVSVILVILSVTTITFAIISFLTSKLYKYLGYIPLLLMFLIIGVLVIVFSNSLLFFIMALN